MQRYKVYHKSDPTRSVIVKNAGFFPMEIKSKAIKNSPRFSYADWSQLRVRRIQ